jgi:hypothetical protein
MHYSVEDVARIFPDYTVCGDEVVVRECPNCGDDRYKFWINPYKGVGHCFICEYAPRMETLLGFSKLGELSTTFKPEKKEVEDLPPLSWINDMDPMHPVYTFLQRRRFTASLLSQFGAQYCHRGKHWKRVVFPFFGPGGEYRGFQGRYIHEPVPEGIPKWSTATGTEKSKMLWNFDRVLARQNWCVLVEGIFDALRMKDWAVAMLGKSPSVTQRALLEYFQHIFIMLDSDATDAAYEVAHDLVEDAVFRVTVIPTEKGDPDDQEFEELGRLVQAVAPYEIAKDLAVFAA